MMGRVSINGGSGDGTTPVSNAFIEEYMTGANDVQIKVYLYLLYVMNASLATDVAEMADRFNYPEQDIHRAIRFWEKKGLMQARFNSGGQLTGLRLENLIPETRFTPLPAVQEVPTKDTDLTDPALKQLLDVIEKYIGAILTPADIDTILFIRGDLHFSDALLDYLVQYCVDLNKKSFSYIKSVALGWHERGVTTVEEAMAERTRYDKDYYALMKLLGMENHLTDTEAAYFTKWLSTYAFPMEIIEEACSRTVVATQSHRLEYCDRILTDWYEAGVKTMDDVRARSESFKASRKAAAALRSSRGKSDAPTEQYKNYTQRQYDYQALEAKLVKN